MHLEEKGIKPGLFGSGNDTVKLRNKLVLREIRRGREVDVIDGDDPCSAHFKGHIFTG